MIKIPTSRGRFSIVDDCDSHLAQWKWSAIPANVKGLEFYAYRQMWVNGKKVGGKAKLLSVYLHQAILGCPLERHLMIDHINGDRLDNRRCNLHIVSPRENQSNLKRRREGQTASKYVGVSWSKEDRKWRARIFINGKRNSLGYFETEGEAAAAYRMALRKV